MERKDMHKQPRYINLDKNELFGPKLTKNIKKDDYFFDCYKMAAKQLIDILNNNTDEFYKIKNIIAFLGNRGQGKTSMMRSFIYAIKYGNELLFDDQLKNCSFYILDVIDPSAFEDCSNVLDIVLSQLLSMVNQYDNDENLFFEDKSMLMQQFDDLYKYINIIKDKNLLYRNFDIYDGSIDTLTTINNISSFKKKLHNLISSCLKMLNKHQNNQDKKPILIIPIDDIDIDIKNCYETVESIRKYLNLPNVVIIMAAKLEQLHEGIRLENLRKMSHVANNDSNRVYEDVYNMTTKYLLKLLPQNRRIHIPNLITNIGALRFQTSIETGETTSFLPIENTLAEILYKKTGIVILTNEQVHNILFNGNLRDLIDLYSCLSQMETPDENKDLNENADKYIDNLEVFKDYFLNNWCTNNLNYKSARIIRKLYYEGSTYKNHFLIETLCNLQVDSESRETLSKLLKKRGKRELFYDLSDVSYYLNKVSNHNHVIDIDDINKFVYAIKMCYTIMLNQLRFIDNLEYRQELSTEEKGKEYTGNPFPHLLRFVGGRILKADVLDRTRYSSGKVIDNGSGKMKCIDSYIRNQLRTVFSTSKNVKNKNKWIDLILFSITKYDEMRDIYHYEPNDSTNLRFFFDPWLFFFNSLDINVTIKTFSSDEIKKLFDDINTDKDEQIDNNSIYNYFNKNKKSLKNKLSSKREAFEIVSRAIVCNFQLYESLIDNLDISYNDQTDLWKIIKNIYESMKKWLEHLKEDLKSQNEKLYKDDILVKSIETVVEELSMLANLFKESNDESIICYRNSRIRRNLKIKRDDNDYSIEDN